MKRTVVALILALALLAGLSVALPQQAAAPKPDRSKILGTWSLDINADGSTVTLNLVLEEAEGKLAGKISEATGMFTDAPLSNIEYDGQVLSYDIIVPSPPDGSAKTWRTELKVGEDTVEGGIANNDFGISATITGKRAKK
jgi:hypothetical protein